MGIEGSLDIRLEVRNGAACRVSIASSRPVQASRVFQGKQIYETRKLIPMLFNICRTAQLCASVRACERALGIQASAQTERLRDALVNMETLREHLWRILLDWPGFTGHQADRAGMAETVAVQREYEHALCSGGDIFRLGGAACRVDNHAIAAVLDRVEGLLQRTIFATSPNAWLKLTHRRELIFWAVAGKTAAARLIDRVARAGWSGAGACTARALPYLPEQTLHRAMEHDEYVLKPQWAGHCCETSSLTRVDSEMLKALQGEYGNGLLVRLVARLTEVALLASRLKQSSQGASGREAMVEPLNPGIGQAEAARGRLIHRVKLSGDVIVSYQILAPTEWNFHPQGVVAQALAALTGDANAVDEKARLLIEAIDPCVGYELSIVQESPTNA